MKLPLLVLLHCYVFVYANTERDSTNSSEKESSSGPQPPYDVQQEDLCVTNQNINDECKVCEMLNHPRSGNCCSDPDALLLCHIAIQEINAEVEGSESEENDFNDSDEDVKGSSEENDIAKRYGSLFSNWRWYSHRNDQHFDDNIAESKRDMEKRYGNLFGSLFSDRKLNKNKKRYGVYRSLYGTGAEKEKRYGNLFGRLFSKNDNKRDAMTKRYSSLFGRLYSDRDKRYGSLFGRLFSDSKRYGSLMGRYYAPPRNDGDKRSTKMEKRYGSLMGRLYSSKKLGR